MSIEAWNRLRRELVWVRRAVVELPHRRVPYRPQGRIAAWRLIKGHATFRLSTGDCRVRAGQWIFAGTGIGERTFSEDAEIISLRFHLQWLRGENLFDHHRPIIVASTGASELDLAGFALADFARETLAPRGVNLLQTPANLDHYLALQTHFDQWIRAYVNVMTKLGHAARQPPQVDTRIQDAVSMLESQLRAGVVMTEAQVARAVGLSLSQFKRLFGRDMKKTPKHWLDDLRFELANDRLSDANRTVKQIGYELGFRSPNHFSSWFTLRRGCPPGQVARR